MFRMLVWSFLLAWFTQGWVCGREFLSADGSKTIEAEFIRYNGQTGKVTLRLPSRRYIVSAATAFSEADQAYFIEYQKRVDMAESIQITIQRDSVNTEKDNRRVTYSFVLKNKGLLPIDGMMVKHWVLIKYHEESKKGKGIDGCAGVEEALPVIPPGGELVVKAAPIDMYEFQWRVGFDSDGRDYNYLEKLKHVIYGARIDLCSMDGQVMQSVSSSNRVDKELAAARQEGLRKP